ncbi:MAG: octanoyltransferase, partial [Gammaproteobacteria bacterium]|nr:octanoyltransferase [Gammaproteobacteria bacterium]
LEPFSRINPCGYPDLQVTQLHNIGIKLDLDQAAEQLTENLRHHLYHQ